MIRVTTSLNKAAFYILKGAVLDSFEGDHWSNAKVIVIMDRDLIDSIHKSGDYSVKDYRKYMAMRSKLKEKCRKVYGGPSLIKEKAYSKKLQNGRNI